MNQSPTGLEVIARYSRIRLAISGLWNLLFGLICLAVAVFPAFIVWKANQPDATPGVVPWPVAFAGLVPLLLSWVTLPTGLNRLRAAFERDCYLRLGPQGVELRIPRENGGVWHPFRYEVSRYVLPLDYFAEVVRHVTTVNGIPTGSQLRLKFKDDSGLRIDRCYFREGTRKIQTRLLSFMDPFA
jgi:hypothetical protein